MKKVQMTTECYRLNYYTHVVPRAMV